MSVLPTLTHPFLLTDEVKADRGCCPRREVTVNGFTRKDGIEITSRQVGN